MEPARIEVEDTSIVLPSGLSPGRRSRLRRPVPRLLAGAVTITLVGDLAGVSRLHTLELRRADADARVTVAVLAAHALPGPAAAAPVEAEAAVAITLQPSVPVQLLATALDGAPAVRVDDASRLSRSPTVVVRWRVLCAEVGTAPGPRLLDVDLRTGSGEAHRRVVLATSDADPVAREYHLTATLACAAGAH